MLFRSINMHNNSLVLFDRFSMENANMVVFAKSGAGKSYAIDKADKVSSITDSFVVFVPSVHSVSTQSVKS